MSKLGMLFKSRKFWAAIVGVVMMIVTELFPNFPLDEAQVEQIVWLLVAYIVGTGIEDSGIMRK